MAEPDPEETEEQEAERIAAYEKDKQRHEEETRQREEERKAEFDRQQKEHEAAAAKREKVQKARTAAFERILNEALAVFTAAQLRAFLKLVVQVDSYNFLEEVANHFANDDDHDKSEQEIIVAFLDATADDKLTGFALRLVLTDHTGIPHEGQPDPLTEAAAAFLIDKLKAKKGAAKAKQPTPIQLTKTAAKKGKNKISGIIIGNLLQVAYTKVSRYARTPDTVEGLLRELFDGPGCQVVRDLPYQANGTPPSRKKVLETPPHKCALTHLLPCSVSLFGPGLWHSHNQRVLPTF